MNLNLRVELEFPTAFYLPDLGPEFCFQLNHYHTQVNLVTATDNNYDVNIAMERAKILIYRELSHAVFVNQAHQDTVSGLKNLGIKVAVLPEEPFDQIIGMVLYCKFNAIMEDRMHVEQIDIASRLGDMVWYQYFADDNLGPLTQPGWWNHPGSDLSPPSAADIVPMLSACSWQKYDLGWSNDASTGNVVYADFKQNGNQ